MPLDREYVKYFRYLHERTRSDGNADGNVGFQRHKGAHVGHRLASAGGREQG